MTHTALFLSVTACLNSWWLIISFLSDFLCKIISNNFSIICIKILSITLALIPDYWPSFCDCHCIFMAKLHWYYTNNNKMPVFNSLLLIIHFYLILNAQYTDFGAKICSNEFATFCATSSRFLPSLMPEIFIQCRKWLKLSEERYFLITPP